MSFVSNIPHSIFNNFLWMGILWLLFEFISNIIKPSSRKLFLFACVLQICASIKFLFDIFSSNTNYLVHFKAISSIQLNPSHPIFICTACIYFFGVLLYLSNFLYKLSKLNQLRISGNFEQESIWLNLLATTSIKINHRIKIGVSQKINSPLVFGFFEPIILLPFSICNQLSPEQIKLILLHEIAHILRNDYIINLIISLTKIVLWFNPFSYLFLRRINLLRELSCDEFVVEHSNAPISYSKALYQLAHNVQPKMPNLAMGAMGTLESDLLIRIKNINQIKNTNTYRFKLIVSVLLLISIGFLGSILISNTTYTNAEKPLIGSNNLKNTYVVYKSKNTPLKEEEKNPKQNRKPIIVQKEPQLEEKNLNNEMNVLVKNDYDILLDETRTWIKQHENPIQFANYSNTNDSLDNLIAERLLMTSIIKSYQLKKAILTQKLSKAKDNNEAIDYLMNSKEWEDIVAYEKWAKEFLGRHQQISSLPSTTTKQQIQY